MKKALLLIILITSIIIACSKKKTDMPNPVPPDKPATEQPPIADFSFQIRNNGEPPCQVNFTNTSKYGTEYQWYFDNKDNNLSTSKDPNTTYAEAGDYYVKLVVRNSKGSDSITKKITITLDKPTADFDYVVENEGAVPCNISFNSTSKNAKSYKWLFGDGAIAQNKSTQHTFNQSISYKVKLIASNASGNDTTEKTIIIKPINYSVRIVLITPTDRAFNQNYYNILKVCAAKLQAWYKTQMNGKTFILNNPVVDTIRGIHPYDWYNRYNDTYSGNDPRYYGYYNTLYEMQQVLGTLNTNLYVTAVYVAAPGGGAGSKGFCALGDQDLEGLLGKNIENLDPNRWVGGSGHEWGHAFGLPHPDNQNPKAIMWTGYATYPNCILQQNDKDILNKSLFFK